MQCVLVPEWAPQSGVMLIWPHRASAWAACLDEVEKVYLNITWEIAKHEFVLIICHNHKHQIHVNKKLALAGIDATHIKLHIAPSNDTWIRDCGPIVILKNDSPQLLDFTFNGWGNKYPADLDNNLTQRLHRQGVFTSTPIEPIGLVLEGGSIDTDGLDTLLTTERCLLSATRNPDITQNGLEKLLNQFLGVKNILWLKNGYLAGDDTDGHIDMLARFCNSNTIAYVTCDDPSDQHYDALKQMEGELKSYFSDNTKDYCLIPLPLPQAKLDTHGNRLPASYANFLIIKDAVLVPTYNDPADDIALSRLKTCFPNRYIIGIECLALIRQYGSLHCSALQLPEGVLLKDGNG